MEWKKLRHTKHSEVVVDYSARRAHEKIRGNQAAGTGKLPLAALDVPDHGPLLEARLSTGTEVA
jgi:hypothetical protein